MSVMPARARKFTYLPPLLVALGEKVRLLREKQGLTRKRLAGRTRLSERFLADVEGGRGNISVLNLAELASALGVRAAELLDDSANRNLGRGVVALLGLRGAGKTTVGKALAQRLGTEFYELDRLVEKEAGMALEELFAIHGEGYFRQLELNVLDRFLLERKDGVLATGGGLVTSPEAYRLLIEKARTVWLKATPEEHWQRVIEQGDTRPMANRPSAMAELKRRLKEREPLYARAELTCVTSGKRVTEVVDQIREAMV